MQGKWPGGTQYLVSQEDISLLNVVDDSILAQLLSIGTSAGSFDDATDSLEAISNAIGAIHWHCKWEGLSDEGRVTEA